MVEWGIFLKLSRLAWNDSTTHSTHSPALHIGYVRLTTTHSPAYSFSLFSLHGSPPPPPLSLYPLSLSLTLILSLSVSHSSSLSLSSLSLSLPLCSERTN